MYPALFKGPLSLLLGGAVIGVPTYLYANTSNISVNIPTFNKPSIASNFGSSPQKETVPVTKEQIEREKKFDECVDNNLIFRVTDTGSKTTQVVSIERIKEYIGNSKWKIEHSYNGQCKGILAGRSQ